MEKNYNIVFLYAEVMGYTVACLNTLANHYNGSIHVICWGNKKLTPYNIEKSNKNIKYINKSSFIDFNDIDKYIYNLKPQIIYVSGRMEKDYLRVVRRQRKKGVKIVSGFDNHWKGGWRQIAAVAFSKYFYHRYFDYIWVAGFQQYEYVRRLGYKDEKILLNVYSADTEKFSKLYTRYHQIKSKKYPHNILFVGRYNKVKGIDLLIRAFKELKSEVHTDWTLTLIGGGFQNVDIDRSEGIFIKDFLQPDELVKEIEHSGIFCLPSIHEPWGVVIHEFAAAGLPLITSNICGASKFFLKEGYNGYSFKSGDYISLKDKLKKLVLANDAELLIMGNRSHYLSKSITPEIWSASLLNIIYAN